MLRTDSNMSLCARYRVLDKKSWSGEVGSVGPQVGWIPPDMLVRKVSKTRPPNALTRLNPLVSLSGPLKSRD